MSNPVTRFFASRAFARALGTVGRFMITSGTVILLLVAYQLWGTNLQTNKSQDTLATQFAAPGSTPTTDPTDDPTVADPTTTTTAPGDATTTPASTKPVKIAPTIAPPADGDVVGRLSIPSIGLHNFYFVQGTTVKQLKRGAGHYVDTPLPGQKGNSAIAGHRTTYAAPLHNIDKVKKGDEIRVDTIQGSFLYRITEQIIVGPKDTDVLKDRGGSTLTLTACHPKFSAKQRIITFATLVGEPVAKLPNQDAAAKAIIEHNKKSGASADVNSIDEFETEPAVTFPGAWWGLGCMLLWIATRLLAWQGHRSRRYPRWIPYVVCTPFCLVMLYFFFEAFSYEGFTRALNLNL